MKKTFVPYSILLLVMIIGIYQLDNLAEDFSEEPQRIRITPATQAEMGQTLWEYEFEAQESQADLPAWKEDSLYVLAKSSYDQQDWS